MARVKKDKIAPTGQPVVLDAETRAQISEWNQIKNWLATGSARELELRNLLAKKFFEKPVEGTNRRVGEGVEIKLTHVLNRTLQKETLDSVMSELYKISPDYCILNRDSSLIEYVPRFKGDIYKQLPADQRKVFEQTLEIKEGTPQLEIVMAKPVIEFQFGQSNPGTSQYTSDPDAQVASTKPPLPAKKESAPVPAGASVSWAGRTKAENVASPSKKAGASKKSSVGKPAKSKPAPKKATAKKKK